VRRFFRAVDAKLILALAALLVTVTVCYGFVQRGDHISSAERSVEDLTGQVVRLLDENGRLHDQLQRIERRTVRREQAAAEDREALSRELLRLTDWLRANGIQVPASTYQSESSPRSEPASSSSQAGRQPQASQGSQAGPGHSGSHGPGNSGGHSNGATVHAGPGGVSVDPPGDLPNPHVP
jgi:hypothetical protein